MSANLAETGRRLAKVRGNPKSGSDLGLYLTQAHFERTQRSFWIRVLVSLITQRSEVQILPSLLINMQVRGTFASDGGRASGVGVNTMIADIAAKVPRGGLASGVQRRLAKLCGRSEGMTSWPTTQRSLLATGASTGSLRPRWRPLPAPASPLRPRVPRAPRPASRHGGDRHLLPLPVPTVGSDAVLRREVQQRLVRGGHAPQFVTQPHRSQSG